LRDVLESDGGFMCIPGSHKARYPVPPELIVCEEAMHMIRHVDMDAGDVAMFLGAAQTHGALPWKNDVSRRAVLLGYSSRYIS
jgi:ectoine hydroxylase-related dioxygenase (phytanoyl-CoA dioxygenase family)